MEHTASKYGLITIQQLTRQDRKEVVAAEATMNPRNVEDCLLMARDDYHAMRRALASNGLDY